MPNDFRQASKLPKRIAVFDLDGCIFDDEWRMHLIKPVGEPDRFGEYHRALVKDATLFAGSTALRSHIEDGDGIAFITARPDSVRQETVAVIRACFSIPFPSEKFCLFMRSDDEEGIGSVELKSKMLLNMLRKMMHGQEVVAAYDDRPDVIAMYLESGITGARILDKHGVREYKPGEPTVLTWPEDKRREPGPTPESIARTAADILEQAGATFRERNAVYKDNAVLVGNVMAALFPNGVQIKTAEDHHMYHLFELIIVKLTRFANSGLKHADSIHDTVVYAAMCENLVEQHNIQFKEIV